MQNQRHQQVNEIGNSELYLFFLSPEQEAKVIYKFMYIYNIGKMVYSKVEAKPSIIMSGFYYTFTL